MKKILLMLSLFVVGLFLAGCVQTEDDSEDSALAGQAIQKIPKETVDKMKQCRQLEKDCGFKTKNQLQIECDPFGSEIDENFDAVNGNALCAEKGQNLCIQGTIMVQNINGPDYFYPIACGETVTSGLVKQIWKDANSSGFGANDGGIIYTCCKIN